MNKTSTFEIADVLSAARPNGDKKINGFAIDSRNIKPGDCFFAIKGENFHGEDFLDKAFENGASCAIVSKTCKDKNNNLIYVNDVVSAMATLAKWYRNKCGFKVVAVTGSAGKTTTRDMIFHVLTDRFKCHKPIKNFNNHIGLPVTLLNAPQDTQVCIVELGANAPGEISCLSKIASPDIALITNVYPAHLEGFGSIENIVVEKCSIRDGLRNSEHLIVNNKMEMVKKYLTDKNLNFECFDSSEFSVKIQFAGRANLENATAAWHVCQKFGIELDYFCQKMKTFQGVEMRMQIFSCDEMTIINDCYNANPGSMSAAIELLEELSMKNCARSVFVCGDMFELGKDSPGLHHQLGLEIAQAGIDVLLGVGKMIENTIKAAKEKGVECYGFKTSEKLAEKIFKYLKPEDVILVKGSRGVALEKIIDKFKT